MRSKSTRTSKPIKDKELMIKGKVTLTDVSGMEQKIAEKTRELQNTAQQIRELSDSIYGYDEDSIDEIPIPHGPMIELHLDPDDQLIDPDIDQEPSDTAKPTENKEEETKVNHSMDTNDIPSDVSARELLDEIREIAKFLVERRQR